MISYGDGTVVDEWSTEGCQDEWVDADERFDDFETDAEPDNAEDGADGEVEEVVAEVIGLVGDFADTSVYTMLG